MRVAFLEKHVDQQRVLVLHFLDDLIGKIRLAMRVPRGLQQLFMWLPMRSWNHTLFCCLSRLRVAETQRWPVGLHTTAKDSRMQRTFT